MEHGRGDGARQGRLCLVLMRIGLVLLVLAQACTSEPSHQGRTAAEWIEQLETAPDSLQRRAAADALGRILEIDPKSGRATAALVRALADTSDEVRLAAGTALVHDRRLPRAAIPGLLDALADSAHAHTREHAAELLRQTAPADAGAITGPLIRALDDPEARVRDASVQALAWLARSAPGVRAALHSTIEVGSPLARAGATHALALADEAGGPARAP